ncbi:hypothetical protein B0H14DRAFT_2603876 [Mycena olivaceomarginata]|nr:hypothetical protein B0H14DRAFT_2603876 [Mycena olivaceomarginata]
MSFNRPYPDRNAITEREGRDMEKIEMLLKRFQDVEDVNQRSGLRRSLNSDDDFGLLIRQVSLALLLDLKPSCSSRVEGSSYAAAQTSHSCLWTWYQANKAIKSQTRSQGRKGRKLTNEVKVLTRYHL